MPMARENLRISLKTATLAFECEGPVEVVLERYREISPRFLGGQSDQSPRQPESPPAAPEAPQPELAPYGLQAVPQALDRDGAAKLFQSIGKKVEAAAKAGDLGTLEALALEHAQDMENIAALPDDEAKAGVTHLKATLARNIQKLKGA